jgi:1,4-dihydroxy-2-naphthoyl-CoA hydrolase
MKGAADAASRATTAEELNRLSPGRLPGLLGVTILEATRERLTSRLEVRDDLLAPNGYLHAATVIALADTTCGYGTVASLPDGATGFTTIELKTNFLGTARGGAIVCEAHAVHRGQTTQVWDATVSDEGSGRPIALFRCTQMVLHPR